jgi:serine/threonine-protein kinase
MPPMMPRAETPAGGVIAGYEIVRLLGRGGMGDVYLAFDPRLERPVALKLLAPRLAEDEGFRARLLRESRLAASLDHPNVVPVYDAGDADGVLFIAMRFVDGTDLRELLRTDGPLAPARAFAIGRQLAGALDAAHARGLVHRDVKPSNVLVDRAEGREHCYLADFGLTQSVRSGPVTDGELLGTIDYVAPEQIRGDRVDGRVDVYALGCLLYEALTGERPFDRTSDVATIFAHLEEEPAPASERGTELPPAVDAVLARAMAKDPNSRQESCAALVHDVGTALGVATPPRASRRLVALLGMLAIVGLAATAVLIATRGGSASPRTPEAGALVRIGAESGEVEGRYPLESVPSHVTAAGGDVWFAAGDALWRLDPDGGKPVKVETVGAIEDVTALGDTVYVAMQGRGFNEGLVVPYFADGIRGDGLALLACSLGAHPSVGLWASDCQNVRRLETRPGRPSIAQTVVIPFLEPVSTGTTRWCVCDVTAGEGDVWAVGDAADRRLWRITPTGGIEATVDLPVIPRSIAATPGTIWVSAPLDDVLVKVDTRSNRVAGSVPVGRSPAGIVSAGASLWVASQLDGTVSRIDTTTGRVQEDVDVGGRPAELAVGDGTIWVTVDERE